MALSPNQIKVAQIADAIFGVKMRPDLFESLEGGTGAFLATVVEAATSLRVAEAIDQGIRIDVDTEELEADADKTAIAQGGNAIVEVADDIASFVSRARAAGFAPPSNPIQALLNFNKTRRLSRLFNNKFLTIHPTSLGRTLSNDILFNLKIYLDFIEKEKAGELDLDTRAADTESHPVSHNSAQISSFVISTAGYDIATTGEQVDLLSFLPDADKIKRRRVRNTLGSLDFKKREPKLLFTANYDPDAISKGCVLGWTKIPDAAGYVITRHSLFDNHDDIFEFNNEQITAEYAEIKAYVNEWVLTFYDQFNSDRVVGFLDKNIVPSNFYTYTLKAFQNIRQDKNFVFAVDASQFIISAVNIADIRAEMTQRVQATIGTKIDGVTVEDISPYPFLSKKFYGHDKYDWILAATNVKAAIDRGEDRATVRSFSYLGSNLSFVRDQMNGRKLFRPADVNEVIRNVKESINTFGLSQTLIEIIETTGLDMFFGAKESPEEETFARAGSVLDGERLDEITTILASVDTETATVDMGVLTTNLLSIIQGKPDDGNPDESSTPKEIDIPETEDDLEFSEDPLQFVGEFDPNQDVLDLGTFEGISEFIRAIRLFFDLSPNRTLFKSRKADTGRIIDEEVTNTKTLITAGKTTSVAAFTATNFSTSGASGTDPKGGSGGGVVG